MWDGLPDPVWRGRRKYWEAVRWARTPETDVAVGLHRKKHSQGWQNDWFLLFRRLGEDQVHYRYLFSQSFQTSGTSVTLSSLSPAWNNADNFVEGIGGGGSGGATQQDSSAATGHATGGGGGEYRKIGNFSDPGGATPMTIGAGGAAKATTVGGGAQHLAGNAGTDTTWNTSSLIAKAGGAGQAPSATPANGGTGGTGGTGAAGNNDGGRGGNLTAAAGSSSASGGGGAGGPSGAGNTGVDSALGNVATNGGQGDGTSGGTGGTGNGTVGGTILGQAGTELGDSVHGCGGGGGGRRAGSNAAIVGGDGGLYGAGGGACVNSGSGNNSSTRATSGAGRDGIVVLTWTAAAGTPTWGFEAGGTDTTRSPYKNLIKKLATIAADGDDGIEDIQRNWFNSGWEVQPPPPPHPRREKAGALMRGDDGTQDIRRNWFNSGWEVQPPQPPHPRRERSGANMRGDRGAQAPFIPPSTNPWAFDQSPHLKPRPRSYTALKSRSEFAFFPPWQNVGFEQTQSQPLHRLFKSPTVGDQGIVFPFVPPAVTAWGFDVQQQVRPRRPKTHMDIGGQDDGIGFPLINFYPTGFEVQPPQPPHPRRERGGALMRGEDGTEFTYINWQNFGFEQTRAQEPRRRWERFALRGIDGIEFPFVAVQAPSWWETSPALHPHRIWKSPTTGDGGIQFPFAQWFNFGWEATLSFPQRVMRERRATLFRGDDGTQYPLINWFNFGWEIQAPQPPHPRRERAAAWMFGDAGTEFPFVFVAAPSFVDALAWQPPHLRRERWGALTGGSDGMDILRRWFNLGWEPTLSFPQRVFRQRRGAIFRGDDGIADIRRNWFNTGWEATLGFPERVIRQRRGAIFRGSDGTEFPFIRLFPFGWPVQPWQPPHRRFERAGAIMLGAAGIEFPFVRGVITWGFEPTFVLPRRRWERAGVLWRGDEGIYHPFRPPVPPFVPPRQAVQLLVVGDPDAFIGPTAIGYVGGSKLLVNKAANMVFDLKTVVPPNVPIDIVLTAPDGSIRHGDPAFAFVGNKSLTYYTFLPFMASQYVVYTFAEEELNQIGLWQVSVHVGNISSSIRTFEVTRGEDEVMPPGVLQSGNVTPGHRVVFVTDNVVADGGPLEGSEKVLASLRGADFSTDADQPILLPPSVTAFQITGIIVTNANVSMTIAQGGFYTASEKGGDQIVADTQVYSALTSADLLMQPTLTAFTQSARFSSNNLTLTLNAENQNCLEIFFALTTVQGFGAQADVYLLGVDLS